MSSRGVTKSWRRTLLISGTLFRANALAYHKGDSMSVTAVIGTQWGDEGKGKAVDYLAGQMDYVARFNGGNNAGHTVINEFGTFKIHLVPSGLFAQNTTGLIGGGVVIDPAVLLEEIEMLNKAGVKVDGRLW